MIVRNIFWDFLGKIFNQGISFVISIFLARMLSPDEFGLIAMVMVIIAFAKVFADFGLTSALIQSKDVSQKSLSTVFWIIFSISCLLTIFLFLMSGQIAKFYDQDDLIPIVKYMSIIFVLESFTSFQRVNLVRKLEFKKLSIIDVISNLISGLITVILVYRNWGVLALVFQRLFALTLGGALVYFKARWLPSFSFSIKSITGILNFGGKTMLSRVISTFFNQMDVVMIGKFFTSSELGLYTRAKSFDLLVTSLSSSSLTSVFFPIISSIQDQQERIEKMFLKALDMVGMVALFLSGVLFCISEDLFQVLFSEKWQYSGELFAIMAVTSFVYPLSSVMINLIVGLGFAGLNLRLVLLKNSVSILPLLAGYFWGIKVFLIGLLFKNLHGLILNMIFVNKATGINPMIQFSRFRSTIIFAAIAAVIPSLLNIDNALIGASVDSVIFASTYLGLIYMFNRQLFTGIKGVLVKLRTQLKVSGQEVNTIEND
ncbi:MAG: O-antigen/teichoic acid export membrane protein [Flavobacteriales bacterium]|jgi:O-antigen/teichoic acid export membrane protein